MTALAGLGAGKEPRGIAEDIWGKEDVAAVWSSDNWMRSQVRRWIPKAQALAAGGCPKGRSRFTRFRDGLAPQKMPWWPTGNIDAAK